MGVQIAGLASALSEIDEVLVLTRGGFEKDYRALEAAGGLPWGKNVQVEFVPEPSGGEYGSYHSLMHLYSARISDRLQELYPNGGPDVIEFPDFLGEGLVTVQQRRAHARFLRNTRIHVRLYTSAEMCSVLDGFIDAGFETRHLHAAERHVLREADRIVWPGGAVLNAYQRFYGNSELASASRVRGLIAEPLENVDSKPLPPAAQELRLVYVGRLERRKGVQDLVRAMSGIRRDAWTLTLVGGDTDTAPLGVPMREQLELTAAGDPRIRFVDALPRPELARLVAESHVLACPSRWECWPSVVLEALAGGRPVIGTPTGGLVEILASPGSGWLTDGVGEESLRRMIEGLLGRPDEVDEAIASGAPRRSYAALTDSAAFRSEHLDALRASDGARRRRRPAPWRALPPLVSVVIPYFRLEGFIEATVRSVFEQDHERLEVIVVNDGCLRPEDAILAELATRYPIRVLTQENAGLGRARNAGISQSRGAYVLPLDADNLLRPAFVRRCVEVLESEPDLVYATPWSQYIDESGQELAGLGYQPIGNYSPAVLDENIAGDATAVIRKRVFDLGHWYSPDLTSYEDWQFYRGLHLARMYGRVIPERLLLYRVRAGSMLREVGINQRDRLYGEMTALLREKEIKWVSSNG